MAFGRSNSLSINTGAANTSGSLFGNSAANPPNAAGSLFGGAASNISQPQASGGLFGNTQSNTTTGGGLFGNTTGGNQLPASQNLPTGGLFGNNNANQSAATGGLFGNNNNNNNSNNGNNNTSNQAGGGGLFGNTNNNTSNQTAGGGMFGNNASTNTGGGLFGASMATNNQTATGNAAGTSLFGGAANTSSLFGNNQNRNNAVGSNSFFNQSQTQQQGQAQAQSLNTSAFGMTGVPIDQLNRSLLGASQFRQSQNMPGSYVGRLTMGQTTSAPAQNTAAVGGTTVTLNELRSTTRFQDLHDDLKTEFEKADKMIQAQENFCARIQAKLQRQGEDVTSIAPDVSMISTKTEAVEHLLASDAQSVEISRRTADKDRKDFERSQRIITNLNLSDTRFHTTNAMYSGQRLAHPAASAADPTAEDNYDTDLIANYFSPLAAELERTLATYDSNLKEIEDHMRVIESSAVSQAQHLAASRAGMTATGGPGSEADSVRDLAETLQGFEQSILGIAGVVGQCREGVNQLVLGQLGASVGQPGNRTGGGRRPW